MIILGIDPGTVKIGYSILDTKNGPKVLDYGLISVKSKDKISSGMIFSIEPGIYIPGFGGVRIEDLVVVQDNKAQLISHSNREIIEL